MTDNTTAIKQVQTSEVKKQKCNDESDENVVDEEEKRNRKSADDKYLFGFRVKVPGSFLQC